MLSSPPNSIPKFNGFFSYVISPIELDFQAGKLMQVDLFMTSFSALFKVISMLQRGSIRGTPAEWYQLYITERFHRFLNITIFEPTEKYTLWFSKYIQINWKSDISTVVIKNFRQNKN